VGRWRSARQEPFGSRRPSQVRPLCALRRVFGAGVGSSLVGELPFAVTHYGEGAVAKAGGAVATPLGPSSFMWYLRTRSGHRSRSPWRTLWVANPTRSKAWQIRPLAN
jgi:hypothetical protein